MKPRPGYLPQPESPGYLVVATPSPMHAGPPCALLGREPRFLGAYHFSASAWRWCEAWGYIAICARLSTRAIRESRKSTSFFASLDKLSAGLR